MHRSVTRAIAHGWCSLVASTTLEMSHGYEIQGEDDPLLSDARTLVENFSHASDAGGYMVNWMPFCTSLCAFTRIRPLNVRLTVSIFPEWLPGMQFKTRAYEWGRQYNMVSQKAYEWVKREMVCNLPQLLVMISDLRLGQRHRPSFDGGEGAF